MLCGGIYQEAERYVGGSIYLKVSHASEEACVAWLA